VLAALLRGKAIMEAREKPLSAVPYRHIRLDRRPSNHFAAIKSGALQIGQIVPGEIQQSKEKPMEQRISVITLGVADLDRSRRFYEEGLGWRRGNQSDEIVFFEANGLIVALFPWDQLAADAQVPSSSEGFRGVTVAYCTRTRAEVAVLLAQAEEAGGRIVKSAQDVFWGGYSGYFADPDGHLWEIAWNPDWTLDKDGNIRMG
jgi:hypothetical protein